MFSNDTSGTITIRNRFDRIPTHKILQTTGNFGQPLIPRRRIHQFMEPSVVPGRVRKPVFPEHQHQLLLGIVQLVQLLLGRTRCREPRRQPFVNLSHLANFCRFTRIDKPHNCSAKGVVSG